MPHLDGGKENKVSLLTRHTDSRTLQIKKGNVVCSAFTIVGVKYFSVQGTNCHTFSGCVLVSKPQCFKANEPNWRYSRKLL